MEIENQNIFFEALKKPINLFLGAGFSVLANDEQGRQLPEGGKLADELREKFNLEHLNNMDLAKLCTIINATKRDALRDFLVERFSVGKFDEHYKYIERLNISTIFTTNIDNLVHKIFEESTNHYINDVNINGPVYRGRDAIDLFMLHGSVLNSVRPMRLGTLEVASSFGADPDRWRYLQTLLRKSPTIFWGYSFEDAATLEAIASHAENIGAISDAWILVHPSSTASGALDYFKALNLQTIIGDTEDFLEYIHKNVSKQAPQVIHDSIKQATELFPSETIPLPSAVPKRQITEFFRGAPPIWSDMFSSAIYRTSHFQSVRDSICSGGHTIITGVPTSGKTTILMQIASEFDYEGYKLILDGPSKAEAELIIRRINADHALIFIDNFTNDIEAFNALSQYPNIVLVGADRDYSLSAVIHLINRSDFKIIDVTELNSQDLQGCRLSIPESIRTEKYTKPEVTHGIRPSLYEFIEANIKAPTLRERFELALNDLQRESPKLAEMLLFVSYVHSCRTPVSMDMVLAYWQDMISGYQEIYDMMRRVGSTLTDYEGDLAIEPQDYFAARSMIVADTVISAASDMAFRKVLLRFHEKISPYRICHNHVFKRYGYDSGKIGRTFNSWQEGRAFYGKIYEKYPNPYVLQQQALFLSARGRYTEAFDAIDKALSETKHSNWTIKNSHAIIMFRANINFPKEPTARKALDHSMQILMQCYHSDRRKAFHAMTFADHATKYWDQYRDHVAQEYLQHASKWLAEQKENEPWLGRIPILQRIVQRRLGPK